MMKVPVCFGNAEPDVFPDFKFTIEGHEYYLPKEDYLIVDRNPLFKQYQIKIMVNAQIPHWILGLNFMKNYLTVFDQEDKKIGFGLSKVASLRLLKHYDEKFYQQADAKFHKRLAKEKKKKEVAKKEAAAEKEETAGDPSERAKEK